MSLRVHPTATFSSPRLSQCSGGGSRFLRVAGVKPALQIFLVESSERTYLHMKAGIHPVYNEISIICACGNQFRTRSTHKGDIRVEICSKCHPFFTGKQRLMDTAGRIADGRAHG